MRKVLTALAIFAASFGGAQADDGSPLTKLTTGEDARGWEAVGRLNIGRTGFCTAALIAPDLLLTAAHCIFDVESGRRIDPTKMEFLAGWRNNRAAAYRGIAQAIPHPDYDVRASGTAAGASRDIAILRLEQPIRNSSVRPFDTSGRPRKGSEVDVVSYAFDRADRPALQEDCHVLARPSDSLVLSCSVDFGSSGAPIFVVEDGVPRIVSVVSSKTEIRGRSVSFGTALVKPLQELRALLESAGPSAQSSGMAVRRIEPGNQSEGSGAKFLRP
jgi:V8-like Glu-specific endopeptidase